jgi:hypothetical protein
LGQKLALLFGDPHRKHLPVKGLILNMFIQIHGISARPENNPLLPALLCFFGHDWLDLPLPLSTGSVSDGQEQCLLL